MNIKHIQAVSTAGFQYWLSDKKSILLRLVMWPNLIPLLIVLFIGFALTVMVFRSEPGGDMSAGGGVTFAIYGDTSYNSQIAIALKQGGKERFTLVETTENDESSIHNAIKNKSITFAIKVTTHKEGNVVLEIVYDRARDYVHKEWINVVKESGADVALSIRRLRFEQSEHLIDSKLVDYNLAPISIDESAYGKSTGSMAAAFMVLMLWSILLVTPLDAAASIASSQMITDASEDFLPIWKAAGVKAGDIVLGRFITALGVFVIALFVFFVYIFFWVSLYIFGADLFVSMLNESQLNNENLYMLTTGFKELIQSIGLKEFISLFLMLISSGAVLLIFRIRLSVYIQDLEQARTKLKPFEIALFNLPLIGFLVGALVPSATLMSVPILNQLVMMQHFFKGGLSWSLIFIGIMSNLVVCSLVYLSAQKHTGNQNRLICR
jgi:hypothetical protein